MAPAPGYLAVSPDSGTVFVASASSEGATTKPHDITTAYNAATGAQLWVTRYDGGNLAGVAVSPDGSRVYVTGSGHLGFETIAYNSATGARAAEHGVGTGGASKIVVSPDGSDLFVTGTATGSGGLSEYATVAYNAATGAQLWGARYQGPSGASSAPAALGLSAAGSTVFVTGTTTLASTHTEFATIAYQA